MVKSIMGSIIEKLWELENMVVNSLIFVIYGNKILVFTILPFVTTVQFSLERERTIAQQGFHYIIRLSSSFYP